MENKNQCILVTTGALAVAALVPCNRKGFSEMRIK